MNKNMHETLTQFDFEHPMIQAPVQILKLCLLNK